MPRHPLTLRLLGLAALILLLYGVLLRVTHWRAELAETNFQANLIRLQGFSLSPAPRAVLVGSSLSGRLLSSYFDDTYLAPVANLGLDGSNPAFGLDWLGDRPPALVIIEVNRLLKPGAANESLLRAATRDPLFRLARYVPVLRSQARPSSILYSYLKVHWSPSGGTPPGAGQRQSDPSLPSAAPDLNEADIAAAKRKLKSQICELQERGCRVCLLQMPDYAHFTAANNAAFALGDELAREFHLPLLDLETEFARRSRPLLSTDGMHLTPACAREASRILADWLRSLPSLPRAVAPATFHPGEPEMGTFASESKP